MSIPLYGPFFDSTHFSLDLLEKAHVFGASRGPRPSVGGLV